MKIIYLVGAKGSGKTYIAEVLAEELKYAFIHFEPIFKKMYAEGASNNDCYGFVEKEVERLFKEGAETIILETTAAAPEFSDHLARLQKIYKIVLTKIQAPLDLCTDRVLNRNQEIHLECSREDVDEWNAVAAKIELPWDRTFDNGASPSTQEILAFFKTVSS